jgi:hypothetical protein
MLQADLAEIKKNWDEVFVLIPDGFRRGGSFFDQLLGVCDSALLFIGAAATMRTDLAYVRRHAVASGKPMAGIIVGASAKAVRRDMEAGK